MALNGLLRIASSQLRRLSLRTTHGIVQLPDQQRCCCHDDSKPEKRKKGRPKAASNKKFSKGVGPAFDLLEKDLRDIMREQERQEKVEARSSLQRRLDLLQSLGCSMDQIQNKVKVLDLSEHVILQRAMMLKKLGCSPVTVSLLLTPNFSTLSILRKHVQRREQIDAAMCDVLQCSLEELDRLKAEHQSLNQDRFLTAESILEKGRLLQSYGITSEEIKACPAVLNIRFKNLKVKLDTLKDLRERGSVQFSEYPLKTVTLSSKIFDKCIENAMLGKAEVDRSPISFATIAQRLGVTAKDIEDASVNFYKMNPSSALEKIDYLLGEGISSAEIVSHIYIMKYHLQNMKRAVEQSKSVVFSPPPPICIVLSFLRSGHLPRRSSFVWSRQKLFVASLFGRESKELPSHLFLKPLWSADRICIKRNFDFLISEGFSEQDIFSCLILLAHDPDHLQAHYLTLWERPDVVVHAEMEMWTDKKLTLSLLQYVIEKDMGFNSAVYNAEVEAEPAVLEKEVHEDSTRKESQSGEILSFSLEAV